MQSSSSNYPPEPWQLSGHGYVSLWLVPADQAPPAGSAALKSVRLFGRTLILTAFIRYDEPSPLLYNELMATQIVRHGWRLRVCITHIWVDSAASRDGGRELWSIPKHLATFERVPHSHYQADGIATLSVRPTRTLRWVLPLRLMLAQPKLGPPSSGDPHVGGNEVVTTSAHGTGRISRSGGRWYFTLGGPLGFLTGRKPVATVAAGDFRLAFGRGPDTQ